MAWARAMAAFLVALIGVFAVSLGGRDQLLVARLAKNLGRSGGLAAVGLAASTASAAAMAVAGSALAGALPGAAAAMLVAFALLAAAAELAWARKPALPTEPTRSLFACLVVLLARQLGDAARFLVFALAAGSAPWLAGAGGALGGAAALALGMALGGDLARWPLRPVRLALAGVLALAGAIVALSARGLIG